MTEKKTAKDLKEVDLTEQRNKRCEPVILAILQKMLDEKLLYSDTAYVESKVLEYLEAIFKNIVIEHEQVIFQGIVNQLKHALTEAIDKRMGKPIGELSIEDLDKILK